MVGSRDIACLFHFINTYKIILHIYSGLHLKEYLLKEETCIRNFNAPNQNMWTPLSAQSKFPVYNHRKSFCKIHFSACQNESYKVLLKPKSVREHKLHDFYWSSYPLEWTDSQERGCMKQITTMNRYRDTNKLAAIQEQVERPRNCTSPNCGGLGSLMGWPEIIVWPFH